MDNIDYLVAEMVNQDVSSFLDQLQSNSAVDEEWAQARSRAVIVFIIFQLANNVVIFNLGEQARRIKTQEKARVVEISSPECNLGGCAENRVDDHPGDQGRKVERNLRNATWPLSLCFVVEKLKPFVHKEESK